VDDKREREEVLETLWHMRERGQRSIGMLKESLGEAYDDRLARELSSDGLVRLVDGGEAVELTPRGEEYARKLVRAHRLAERLIHDVLGRESESGACEFEHTVNLELVDGICTLLGHPRECPHGMSIPEGECCRLSITSAQSSVVPLTQLEVGTLARVAYVQCGDDRQMHKLEDLLVRPGVTVKLHQVYPTFVVECEGASIALDRDVASGIRVWRPSPPAGEARPRQRGRHTRFRFRHRGAGPG
jgi:DtxR family Mn-dependent transcriptional regulator